MKSLISLLIILLPLVGISDDLRRVVDLRGEWRFTIGDNPRWSSPDFDDRNWEKIFVPSPWENEGFSGFDGYAWYRITLDLHGLSESNLYLVLGYIDDVDQVFLNGEMIGFSGSFPPRFYTAYQSFRRYRIPPELLNKDGKNVIAVRVYDTVLDGGIIKGDVGIYTNRNEPEKTLLLEGPWRFREGDNVRWKENDYDISDWEYMMVPGFWKSMKHSRLEGVIWYKKEFVLPPQLQEESKLVLVLGKIDDFDHTYLNGVLIGSTNDGKPFGLSDSWHQYRVYPIPNKLLNRKGKNVLSVRVSDMGGNAGIYEGPLGIVPFSSYRQLLNARDY